MQIERSYKIDINELLECDNVEWRSAALVGGVWMFEQANGEWMQFPDSEYVIYPDN